MALKKIYTYFHVREDGLSLFGFKQREEKNLFLKLIEVSGIVGWAAVEVNVIG